MIKKILYLIILVVVFGGVLALVKTDRSPLSDIASQTYTSEKYGISFSYPRGYFIEEKEVGDAHRGHYSILLIEDTEENRNLFEGESTTPREGPTAISFDIYQNNLDQQSLSSWLNGSNASNFKLSDGAVASTTVGGKEAISYSWDGLYRADNVAFSHNGTIISVVVTYLSPDDAIREDFTEVISSVKLLPQKPISQTEAETYVKGMFHDLAGYPHDGLPPRFIKSEPSPNGWYVQFTTEGSGVPYILDAKCYHVTHSKEVTKIGEYKHKPNSSGASKLAPASCTAA